MVHVYVVLTIPICLSLAASRGEMKSWSTILFRWGMSKPYTQIHGKHMTSYPHNYHFKSLSMNIVNTAGLRLGCIVRH